MLTDSLLQLASGQAVTVSAVSENSIDLGEARDIGVGAPLFAVFSVGVSAAAATAAEVTLGVVSGSGVDASGAINAGVTYIGGTGPIPFADLTAGRSPISVPIPPSIIEALPIGQRYLGVQFIVGTGPLTAGSFSAVIGDSEANVGKFYPSGFAVA